MSSGYRNFHFFKRSSAGLQPCLIIAELKLCATNPHRRCANLRIIGQAREYAYVWDGWRQDAEEIVNWVG